MKYIGHALLFFAFSAGAWAQVTVNNAWVRATVPQQSTSGAYMQLNALQDVRLVAVKSGVAKTAEIHEMQMAGNVMKMRPVKAIDLPIGKTVELTPNGYHVMLVDLKQQIKAGDVVPLSLVFEDKNKKQFSLEIKAIARPLNDIQAPSALHTH